MWLCVHNRNLFRLFHLLRWFWHLLYWLHHLITFQILYVGQVDCPEEGEARHKEDAISLGDESEVDCLKINLKFESSTTPHLRYNYVVLTPITGQIVTAIAYVGSNFALTSATACNRFENDKLVLCCTVFSHILPILTSAAENDSNHVIL